MSSSAPATEFKDLASRQHMWASFTRLMFRTVIGVAILVLFLGWITGVL